MPTEAKRETVAELREALAGSRTLIVSEYRGLTRQGDRRDPPRPAQAGRDATASSRTA